MTPIDLAVLGVIACIVGGAVVYVVRSKKKGKKCIGCPYAGTCGKGGGCSCQTHGEADEPTKK